MKAGALSRPSLSFHDVSRFRMCLLVQTKSEGVGGRAASALRVLLTLFLSSHFPFLNRGRQRPWPPPRRSGRSASTTYAERIGLLTRGLGTVLARSPLSLGRKVGVVAYCVFGRAHFTSNTRYERQLSYP